MIKLSPPIYTPEALSNYQREIAAGRWKDGPCIVELEAKLAQLSGVTADQVVCTDTCTRALACAGTLLRGTTISTWAATFPSAYTWAHKVLFARFGYLPVDISNDLWGIRRPTGLIVDGAHRFRPDEVPSRFAEGARAVCWSFGCQKELPGVWGGAIVLREPQPDAREWLRVRKGLMANADAAWLLGQLPATLTWRAARQRVLGWYAEHLQGTLTQLRTLPGQASGHLAVVLFPSVAKRARAMRALERGGIESSIHYPGKREEGVCGTVLSLPCHPEMSEADVERVVRTLGYFRHSS